MEFSFTKQEKNSIVIYQLSGKLIDTSDIETFTNDAKQEIKSGKNKLILNLTNLSFLNSSGLNGLIIILTKSRNNEGETVLCDLPESIKKLFLVTKLNTVFTILKNEEAAVQHLNKNA